MPWDHFEPSRPREAKGGIKARSRRGAFGETWWGRRWMESLEALGMESRLTRGRTYARSGQVLSLETASGGVQASVQGSRPKPYAVRMRLATLDGTDQARIADALRKEPVLAARLLTGEMPEEIEHVFQAARVSLFPGQQKDLQATCSCPDDASPCKHLAAVYCLLAEEFGRDPLLLLSLRGCDRDTLLALLALDAAPPTEGDAPALPPEPLPANAGAFWEGTGASPSLAAVHRPPVSAPFWRGEIPLAESLAPLYENASTRQQEP